MHPATRSWSRGYRSIPIPSTRAATPATPSRGARRRVRRRHRRSHPGTRGTFVPPSRLDVLLPDPPGRGEGERGALSGGELANVVADSDCDRAAAAHAEGGQREFAAGQSDL